MAQKGKFGERSMRQWLGWWRAASIYALRRGDDGLIAEQEKTVPFEDGLKPRRFWWQGLLKIFR